MSRLEHVNITVSNPSATAEWLGRVFGWRIRWQGAAISGGETAHIGDEQGYIAAYAPPKQKPGAASSYATLGGLNHVGVVVDDLAAAEKRVVGEGFVPVNHGDYEPGRRFYFHDHDGIEWEVVSYA